DYVASTCSHDLLNKRFELNSINFVQFPDALHQNEWTEVVPTVLSVADCSNTEHVRYHFGYEALKVMKK
ncbi:hypothetical protein, partial [Lysinibacillus sp. D4B1_S16]|uniref:hypothetical protein n=1 Tax=Lysinibacillus sp. D4B1_S16 TaxID=2941231 RepID=UPI0020BF2856